MKFLIKLLLIAGIVVFGLWNYRILTFEKGISKTEFENKSVIETLSTLSNITKVEYYKRTLVKENSDSSTQDDYIYNVYIETTTDAYLLGATQEAVNMFDSLGVFKKSLTPNKITPVPFYVEIILAVIILIIPFGRRKRRRKRERDDYDY